MINDVMRDCPRRCTSEQRGGVVEVANTTLWIVACECLVRTVVVSDKVEMAGASIAYVLEAA